MNQERIQQLTRILQDAHKASTTRKNHSGLTPSDILTIRLLLGHDPSKKSLTALFREVPEAAVAVERIWEKFDHDFAAVISFIAQTKTG